MAQGLFPVVFLVCCYLLFTTLFLRTGSQVEQTGLELPIFLPKPPEYVRGLQACPTIAVGTSALALTHQHEVSYKFSRFPSCPCAKNFRLGIFRFKSLKLCFTEKTPMNTHGAD